MKHVLKLFKPLIIFIIAVIGLLYVQARLELRLPDYTANIVDTGIQQHGIENAVYKEITKESFNHVLIFVDDYDYVKSSYHLIKKDDKNIKKYPLLATTDIYILNDDADIKKLEDEMRDAIFLKNMVDNAEGNSYIKTVFPADNINVDAMYAYLQKDRKNNSGILIESFKVGIKDISDSIKKQSNIQSIYNEYKEIGINTKTRQLNYLYSSGFKMLIISFVVMIISIIVCFLSSMIGSRFSHDLRTKLVHKIMSYSNQEYEEFSTASLITRTTNDVQQVQMFLIMFLRIVIFAPILGLGALGKVWGSSLSWIIGLAILLIFMVIIILFVIAFPKFKIIQKVIDKVNLISREILTGLPVIRAFSNEKYEEKRFDKANRNLTKINLFVNKVMVYMMPFMAFVMNSVAVFIVWFGAKGVNTGSLQVGDMMAFITYSMQVIISFLMLSLVSIILPRAVVSFKRISEVLDKDSTILDPVNPKTLKKNSPLTVKFNDVNFMYHDANENVIENISFEAKPGTVTAIIGSTGCGKSTLVNLIPRFFDVSSGSITINDIDIRDLTLEDLRRNIGYVPQKGFLFTGDIESNLKLSKEKVTDEDMKRAARIAEATEFINKREKKYHDEISEGGTNVSGGQKQRLAIARALAFNPKILIFDDSFSAVDYKTDSLLRKNIRKNIKDATTFIVAQRISTIMDADQIIVLDSGKIVGIGNHDKLMKSCSVYKEIALSQLSKEELV